MSANKKRRLRKAPRQPLYQQITAELRAAIMQGKHRDLKQFPTESELCARYGVSRYTVREALRALQLEGLIERTRGSGTTIQPASARGGTSYQLSTISEILQYARDTKFAFTALGSKPIPKALAAHAGVPANERWFHFRGLRTQTGHTKPIALTDAYVRGDFASVLDQIRPAGVAIFKQLERLARIEVTHVTQDIRAVTATAPVAAELLIPRRSACLHILRRYLDANGKIVEISSSHHPGERFAYSLRVDLPK